MTQQTTQHPLAESISALMDNQASELELQRILKTSDSDAEVKATWSRYQIASAALRRDLPSIELSDFAARISAALDEEETYSASGAAADSSIKSTANKTSWLQNIGRFAVAASVAGGVVFFAQTYNGSTDAAPVVASTVEAPATAPTVSVPAGYHAQPLTARTVGLQSGYESRQQDNRQQVVFVPRQSSAEAKAQVPNEEVRDYLNQLIEEHADNAALNSGQGMLPFARVVMTEED